MEEGGVVVMFAEKGRESEFLRLAESEQPEDRDTYRVLLQIRNGLRLLHPAGTEIPPAELPAVYGDILEGSNLWAVELPPYGTILYTRVGNEILIVDIV